MYLPMRKPFTNVIIGLVSAMALYGSAVQAQVTQVQDAPPKTGTQTPPALELDLPNGVIPQAPIDQHPFVPGDGDLDAIFEDENGPSPEGERFPRPPGFEDIPDIDIPQPEDPQLGMAETPNATAETPLLTERPDYSELSELEERKEKLDALFLRLQGAETEESAGLIAEEIWAIWLDSGSQSVNLLLRRGTAAQKRGDKSLARRMYNHVTSLSPEFAEGWARSARLSLEEEDFSRALSDVTQALILEPRQFYAHWTLGNIFERVGRNEAAFQAYQEAARLYPELKAVKDRLKMIEKSVEGDVL